MNGPDPNRPDPMPERTVLERVVVFVIIRRPAFGIFGLYGGCSAASRRRRGGRRRRGRLFGCLRCGVGRRILRGCSGTRTPDRNSARINMGTRALQTKMSARLQEAIMVATSTSLPQR